MGRFCIRIAILALACSATSGCFIADFFKTEEPFDVAGGYIPPDKPRIRPGVGIVVQVGATGVKPVVMEAQVDTNGMATLPYLLKEPVLCDGLTIEACQEKLLKLYQQYMRQPQVTVRFASIDPKSGVSPYGTVTVMGEVHNPGPVNMPPTMDLTVTKAIQAAGGTKPFADKTRVRVTRHTEDGRSVTMVDLDEIGKKGRIDKDIRLKPGDVVYVHETMW